VKVSRRAPKRKTCGIGAKRRFPDRASAIASLHTLKSHSGRDKVPARAYQCPECNGWHLTSQSPRGGG
jgi:hypothetical protein